MTDRGPSAWIAGMPEIETMLRELEQAMPHVQRDNSDVFALAHAWAERHDAILAKTPPAMLPEVQARLSRIGIRWGVMPGARVTTEFKALGDVASLADLLRLSGKPK